MFLRGAAAFASSGAGSLVLSAGVPRVVALVAGLALALPASATATYSEVTTYARGYLVPGQGFASATDDATYANWCTAIWMAEIDKPGTYCATAALIAPDGSWMRSTRGSGPAVSVLVSSLTVTGARAYRKKAYGKNSDPIWVYAATAKLGRYVSNNPGCPIPALTS
jgi:hypothetical protein